MKIAIIGYSGSGKSTLAKALARHYGCEVLHLDRLHWLPGWAEREQGEEAALVEEFMDAHESWIIDGNYSFLAYRRRMLEADQILFLDFGRVDCLRRVVSRYLAERGRTRDSMADGCPEKLDAAFLRWVLLDGRSQKQWMQYNAVQRHCADKTVVLKNQKQLDLFYQYNGLAPELPAAKPDKKKGK